MIRITVSDPRIEDPDTRHSFASYLVSTPEGNSVRRRYSDFRWLYHRLQTEVPGALVPIIPHTRTLLSSKKFTPEFLEERRRDLQDFLLAVARHQELCRAPSMTPFMLLPLGKDFDDGKKTVEHAVPTEATKWAEEIAGTSEPTSKATVAAKGIGKLFSKMRLSSGSQELLTTPDEAEVVALHAYVSEVSEQVKSLARASDALVKSTLKNAEAHHELGIPVGLWRTSYLQQQQHGDQNEDAKSALAGICRFSDEMATLLRQKHKEEESLFGHGIHKLANTVSAFEIALGQRKKAQVAYTHSNNGFLEKTAALERAQKAPKPPEVTDKLASERAELEARIEADRNRFCEVTRRLLRDAEAQKPGLVGMLRDAVLAHARAQVSYTARIHEACQRMIPSLEALGAGSPPPLASAPAESESGPPPPPSEDGES